MFLDIRDQVRLRTTRSNEEGFLGLAFHPKFKTNGEFFVFYTDETRQADQRLVALPRQQGRSRTRPTPRPRRSCCSIDQPFWNHDGGTIVFGPDGYLYVVHRRRRCRRTIPHENGQNLKTLLGKILRIDVTSKADGKTTPFPRTIRSSARSDAAPEIWAYGLRNVWRMAFDRKTGRLWAADVGQNLYEEINLIDKGGNYGWSMREGLHPVRPEGRRPTPGLDRSDLGIPSRRRQVDHRRHRLSRQAACRSWTALPLRRLRLRQDLGAAIRRQKAKRVVANRPIARPQVADYVIRRRRPRRIILDDVRPKRAGDLSVRSWNRYPEMTP